MLPSIFGENLFDDFFEDPFGMMPALRTRDVLYGKHGKSLMKTDVRELDNGYELDMDLPGFKKDEVQVDVRDGFLTVSAAKGLNKDEKKDGKLIRQERYTGQCSRSFYVGEGVESGDVSARFEDGILRICLPKNQQKKLPATTTVTIE
ncbi:MAG: Hsp20/alpha crystallin family protein [Eubacteriales bacterium]|nr:Hsp20/alpha crystallin family protein [Eubacteriales bacterium]